MLCLIGQQKTRLAEIDTTVNSSLPQYGGMGYASYLVMRDGGDLVSLSLYSTQLALNWAWTPIFFGSHNVKAAFYEICLLWIAVAATGVNFYSVNKVNIDLKVLSSCGRMESNSLWERWPACSSFHIKPGSPLPHF